MPAGGYSVAEEIMSGGADFAVELRGFEPMANAGAVRSRAIALFASPSQCNYLIDLRHAVIMDVEAAALERDLISSQCRGLAIGAATNVIHGAGRPGAYRQRRNAHAIARPRAIQSDRSISTQNCFASSLRSAMALVEEEWRQEVSPPFQGIDLAVCDYNDWGLPWMVGSNVRLS
jgi:hypothetical protein